jgi:hypothetical protein
MYVVALSSIEGAVGDKYTSTTVKKSDVPVIVSLPSPVFMMPDKLWTPQRQTNASDYVVTIPVSMVPAML